MKLFVLTAVLAASLSGCMIVTYPENSYTQRQYQPQASNGTSYHLNSEYFPTLHVPALSTVKYDNTGLQQSSVKSVNQPLKPVVKGTASGNEKVTYVNKNGKTVTIVQSPLPKVAVPTTKPKTPPVKKQQKQQTVDEAIKQALDAATPADY